MLVEAVGDVLEVVRERFTRSQELREFGEANSAYSYPDRAMLETASIARARCVLLTCLTSTPTYRDILIRLSGLPVDLASAALLEMELSREVLVKADGRYSSG